MIKRIFDIVLAVILIIILALPMLLIAAIVRITSEGPVLYWSNRVGQNNVLFKMPKFRSMIVDTPTTKNNMLGIFDEILTPVGKFLRNTSIDELPQLLCILKNDMSFVGYRPVLPVDDDLVKLRTQHDISKLKPGLTGWAQINGRDKLTISERVRFELEYMGKRSFFFDLKILFLTFLKVIKREGILY